MGFLTKYRHNGSDLVRGGVLIETGTYAGDSLIAAAGKGFRRMISIELCPEYHYKTARRLTDLGIEADLRLGSSPDILPEVIDRSEPTLFWLDAHFQGEHQHEIDPAHGECPVLEELRIIFSAGWSVAPYVLIDDAAEFIPLAHNPLLDPDQWPTLDMIRELLPADYTVDVDAAENCIVCLPSSSQ
jgi:hypothetical protein